MVGSVARAVVSKRKVKPGLLWALTIKKRRTRRRWNLCRPVLWDRALCVLVLLFCRLLSPRGAALTTIHTIDTPPRVGAI